MGGGRGSKVEEFKRRSEVQVGDECLSREVQVGDECLSSRER